MTNNKEWEQLREESFWELKVDDVSRRGHPLSHPFSGVSGSLVSALDRNSTVKDHKPSSLNNTRLLSHSLRGWGSEIKESAELVLQKAMREDLSQAFLFDW